MFKTITSFIDGSIWAKFIIYGLLAVACYALGHGSGYASGHTKGFDEGRDSRDQEVATLTKQVGDLSTLINTERKAQADKVKKLEQDAADTAVATAKALAQKQRERDAIVVKYKESTPPEIKQSCGLSIETVRAINKLIDNSNENPDSYSPLDQPDSVGDRSGSSGDSDGGPPSRDAVPTLGDDHASK